MFGKNTFHFSETLSPHPEDPKNFSPVSVSFALRGSVIQLHFDLNSNGAIEDLASPNPLELWKGSCLELFLKHKDCYWEWNFSLTGQGRLYVFDSWRQRVDSSPHNPTGLLEFKKQANSYALHLDPGFVSPLLRQQLLVAPQSLFVKICCIRLTKNGYGHFCANHPEGPPNFHCQEAFRTLQ
jgi:hypothetical protein